MRQAKLFRKIACFSGIFFLIFTLSVLGTADNSQAARQFVRLGGSNPGGSWFIIAGGLSSLLNKNLTDVNVTPVATGGSADNNRQARQNGLDVWLTHSLTAYDNYHGTGLFEGKGEFKDYRMMFGVYESWHHFVVLDKSDIKSMSDLKGKRIAVGAAGSGAAVNSENILRALGLWDQLEAEHLTFDASGRALADGQVDAVSLSSAPMAAIVSVEASHKIRLIALTDQEIKTVMKKFPAYKKATMPAMVYKSWDKPYPCIAFQVYLAANQNVDADVVSQMMGALMDPANATFLGRVHRQLKTISPAFDGIEGLGIPLHPGAVKYYKEMGKSVPKKIMP